MKLSIPALVAKIAGGALAGLAPILGTLFPNQQVVFTAIFGTTGLLVLVAGLIVQSLQPAASIVQDAPVVNTAGVSVGTNVSTTSTDPIKAPQAQKDPTP